MISGRIQGYPGCKVPLYHTTSPENAKSILKSGRMKMGSSGGAVGNGIYWAENIEASKRKARNKGVTLQANVELGISMIIDNKRELRSYSSYELRNVGCDSIIITCLNGTEYVVFNPSQVSNIEVCEGYVDSSDEFSFIQHDAVPFFVMSNNVRPTINSTRIIEELLVKRRSIHSVFVELSLFELGPGLRR